MKERWRMLAVAWVDVGKTRRLVFCVIMSQLSWTLVPAALFVIDNVRLESHRSILTMHRMSWKPCVLQVKIRQDGVW